MICSWIVSGFSSLFVLLISYMTFFVMSYVVCLIACMSRCVKKVLFLFGISNVCGLHGLYCLRMCSELGTAAPQRTIHTLTTQGIVHIPERA